MNKILIVEDSKMFANLLKKRVADNFGMDCVICESYQQAAELLLENAADFLLAILDLTLPGSPDGEIVDLVKEMGIPVVVVTGRMDDQTRSKILGKGIIDYIMKGPHTLDLLSTTIRRFLRNQQVKVLLVDDSRLVRENTGKILQTQNFIVIEAENGVVAMAQLKANPDIRVVLTDYHMPEMDGFELTAAIRKSFSMDTVAIIGMSAHDNPLLSSQFLKRGANDFINKPYFEEELVWRVNQNVEILEHISQLREAAIKDMLTGLYNRRYFFDAGSKLYENARRENLAINIAMIDIDHFKGINDTYGHSCGDQVLIEVGRALQGSFRATDIVARLGGEEFVVMTCNVAGENATGHFETVCEKISELFIETQGHAIQTSVSIGVTTVFENSLDEMVRQADALLYQAKDSGRNCVIVH